ncbi:GH35 family beta-galactosidase [Arthrobacter sp. MDT2-16]
MSGGKPFLIVGSEVHNSSSSSVQTISRSFGTVRDLGANTVLAPVAWDLFEPEENCFDFTLVDAMVTTARQLGLHLIPLWFGSWKNAASTYAPAWVKTDQARFPRAVLPEGRPVEHLSPFSSESRNADSRAFQALMRRIKEIDTDGTVLMVQVENEIGLLGAARDHSALADAAFVQDVPAGVIAAVAGDTTMPLHQDWLDAGSRSEGSWHHVFGASERTDEAFMAASYATYVEAIAEAGKRELDVPLFVNAWLDADSALDGPVAVAGGKAPGAYPSGGPVLRVAAIWEALAPAIDFLAPDMYVDEAEAMLADYAGRRGRLFIPELRADAEGIAQMFSAVGTHRALGVSPFGVDSMDPTADSSTALKDAFYLLSAAGHILSKNPQATMQGFVLNHQSPSVTLTFANASLQVDTQSEWVPSEPVYPGYGIAIEDGDGAFILGRGFWVTPIATEGRQVSILSAEEYTLEDGRFEVTRRLNGDETSSGTLVPFPFLGTPVLPDRLIPTKIPDAGIVRFKTYSY